MRPRLLDQACPCQHKGGRTMTSATEHLRALLDERGVEYTTEDKQIVRYTDWGGWFFAEPLDAEPNTLGAQCELVCMPVTPEQAIDATLGRGTCRDLAETPDYRYKTQFECSECGYEYSAVGGFGCDYGDEPDFRFCPNCGRRVEVDA